MSALYIFVYAIGYPGYFSGLLMLLTFTALAIFKRGFYLAGFIVGFALIGLNLASINLKTWRVYQAQKAKVSSESVTILEPSKPLGGRESYIIEVATTGSQSRPGYKETIEIIRYGNKDDQPATPSVWIRPKQAFEITQCGLLYELEHDKKTPCTVQSSTGGMIIASRPDLRAKAYVVQKGQHWITIRDSNLSAAEIEEYVRGLKPGTPSALWKFRFW